MKMTKKDLKNMMKECIIELIKEGAFNGTSVMPNTQPQQGQFGTMVNPALFGQPMGYQSQQPVPQVPMHMLQNAVQPSNDVTMEMMARQAAANAASGFGDERTRKQFQSLFEDTIMNTLPNQSIMTEQYSEVHAAQDVQKLNAIPGLDVSRMAKLAFSGQKKRLPGMRTADDDDLG